MRRISIILIFGLFNISLSGQSSLDSLTILSFGELYEWIKAYHPLVQAAQLETNRAEAELTGARGAFDPKIFGDWDQKAFDNKDYFAVGEGGIKIPTRLFGAEFKASYNHTRGIFLNPMLNIPDQGQLELGVKVPLLQGRRIDEQRAKWRQAILEQPRSQAMYRKEAALIILEASELYWKWWKAFHQLEQYDFAIDLTQTRLEGIVESFVQGDKPAIDTLETFIQLQTRMQQRSDAFIDFQKASWDLSNFFGGEEEMALVLSSQYQPSIEWASTGLPASAALDEMMSQVIAQNPELLELDIQRQQQEVKQKWAREQLLPKLDVEYAFLGDGFDLLNQDRPESINSDFNQLLTQNYKWKLSFEMPLFFRKGRGKVQEQNIKLSQLELKRKQKAISLSNKVQNHFIELRNLRNQIELLEDMVENYSTLLDMEQTKFEIGESSVFLLNSREIKLIESKIKLVSTKETYLKAFWKLQWVLGSLV